MVNDYALASRMRLESQVTIPETSTTTNIAEYIRVGGVEYKFKGGSGGSPFVTFALEVTEEGVKTEYTLTDAQVAVFQNAGDKPLVLTAMREAVQMVFLLNRVSRSAGSVKYDGESGTTLTQSFTVVYSEKKATLSYQRYDFVTLDTLKNYVAPSETVVPTKTAKSLKVGDEYWNFSSADSPFITFPLEMEGGQPKERYTLTAEQVEMFRNAGNKPLMLTASESGTNIFYLMTMSMRDSESVFYMSAYNTTLDFGVNYALSIAELALGNRFATEEYVKQYVVADESAVPVKTATAVKIGDVYWGISASDCVRKIGDSMTGPLVMDCTEETNAYITATAAMSAVAIMSPNAVAGRGMTFSVSDSKIVMSMGEPGKSLIYEMTDGSSYPTLRFLDKDVLTKMDIANHLMATVEGMALDATQGKILNDRIDAIGTIGRFLSLWDCTTGLPVDNPPGTSTGSVYTYKTGDYYIVSKVGTTNNLRPDGATYIVDTPSTTVDTSEIKGGYHYRYTGTGWVLESVQQQEVSFKTLTGAVADNAALVSEFSKYAKVSGAEFTGNVKFRGRLMTIQNSSVSSIVCESPLVTVGLGNNTLEFIAGSDTSFVFNGSDITYNTYHILNTSDIVNDITSGGTAKALSAEQGKVLASKMPFVTIIPANTATEVDAPRYGGIIVANGNLVAIGSIVSESGKFWANGQPLSSGGSFNISFVNTDGSKGTVTVTLTLVSMTKYSIIANNNIMFMG